MAFELGIAAFHAAALSCFILSILTAVIGDNRGLVDDSCLALMFRFLDRPVLRWSDKQNSVWKLVLGSEKGKKSWFHEDLPSSGHPKTSPFCNPDILVKYLFFNVP